METRASQRIQEAGLQDFYPLQQFFKENGLEIDLSQTRQPDNVLQIWKIQGERGEPLAAAKVEKRAGEFVLGCIAVEKNHRRSDLGSALLKTAIAYCREQGATRVLLVAKVPAFFKTHGFYQVSMEDHQAITKCYACPQRGDTCHPQVLRLDLL